MKAFGANVSYVTLPHSYALLPQAAAPRHPPPQRRSERAAWAARAPFGPLGRFRRDKAPQCRALLEGH